MKDFNQQIISYREAADELGRKLIRLYDLRMFPRQGKNFADQLFASGMEAGAYLSTIADVEDRAVKKDAAIKAYDLLNRTLYIISFMKNAKFYAQSDVFEIEEYLGSLIKAVREVIVVTCSQMNVKPTPQPAPAPAPRPAPQPQIITQPAPAPQPQSPQVIIMRDGMRPAPQPVMQPVVQPIYQMPPQPQPKHHKEKPAPRPAPAPQPAPKPREEDPWDDDPDGFNSPADY